MMTPDQINRFNRSEQILVVIGGFVAGVMSWLVLARLLGIELPLAPAPSMWVVLSLLFAGTTLYLLPFAARAWTAAASEPSEAKL